MSRGQDSCDNRRIPLKVNIFAARGTGNNAISVEIAGLCTLDRIAVIIEEYPSKKLHSMYLGQTYADNIKII